MNVHWNQLKGISTNEARQRCIVALQKIIEEQDRLRREVEAERNRPPCTFGEWQIDVGNISVGF